MTNAKPPVSVLAYILSFFVCAMIGMYMPYAIDWFGAYRPACAALVAGHSPYMLAEPINEPPWAFALCPIALLPERLSRAVMFGLSLMVFMELARRLGAGRLSAVLFLTSPPVLHCLINGNVDAFVMAGALFPGPVGLLVALTKPQVGVGIALMWTMLAFRRGGVRDVGRLWWLASLCSLCSLAIFGPWFLNNLSLLRHGAAWWNASIWPWGIPIGILLIAAAMKHDNAGYALASGPFFSPYAALYSWSGVFVPLFRYPQLMAVAAGTLWLLVVIEVLCVR